MNTKKIMQTAIVGSIIVVQVNVSIQKRYYMSVASELKILRTVWSSM